jgi:hypothetical protein
MIISAKVLGLKLKNEMSRVSLLDTKNKRTNILFCHIVSDCGHKCGKYHPALDVCPPCDHSSTNPCFGNCKKYITVKCFGIKRKLEDFQCSEKCHKQLDCSHLCSRLCHKGSCNSTSKCIEKVIVRCDCRCINHELKCHEAQNLLKENSKYKSRKKTFKQFIVPCTPECSESRTNSSSLNIGGGETSSSQTQVNKNHNILKKKKNPTVSKLDKNKKLKSKAIKRADAVRAASQAIKVQQGSQFVSLERYVSVILLIYLSVITFMLLVDEFITKPAYEMKFYEEEEKYDDYDDYY